MSNLSLPKYDYARNAIKNMKKNGLDWDSIIKQYDSLKITFSEEIDESIWRELVSDYKSTYKAQKRIKKAKKDGAMISKKEDNEISIPNEEQSSWQLYRKKLFEKGFKEEDINDLEQSTIKILKKLNTNTLKSGPVKGLVIGQVQSGKTASMAGLMAMAADWGWNTFIILSGMIENLRQQTQERLITDLNSPGNISWISLNHLSKHSDIGQRSQSLNFNEGSPTRYLNVCIKNKTRLENLVSWFKDDSNKLQQMRILIIDDEADQASVNTNKLDEEERTTINNLIIELVNISSQGKKPLAVNYVSYTATPYSNFLNESDDESLYPKDFISVLPTSSEYIGPKQIFGTEDFEDDNEERLDIVRIISINEKDKIKEIHNGLLETIPNTFEQSILWFLISTSILRYYNYKKPVSMLVHTSQRKNHHQRIAFAIDNWIKNTPAEKIIKMCEDLYIKESNRFKISDFRKGLPNYPFEDNEINNYPNFNAIKTHLKELLSNKPTHILMDEEGELSYHKGIHLCIDNSSNTSGIYDEDMYVRLAYPTIKKLNELKTAPAFIIVGGSTLSRGLTIEGLVSTYFLRVAQAGDSLMQMGRWFGYRRGYELLPRIWMTENTFEQFQFLATLDEELREELNEFAIGNKHPSEYGPRVKNTPKVSWLRITARNKMQDAIEIDMDFSGASVQTIHFDNDKQILQNNIEVTENFLNNNCGEPIESEITNSLFFKNVDFEIIKNEFLLKMKFNERSRVFNDILTFCDWFDNVKDEINFENWNIIVPSSGKINKDEPNEKEWKLGPYTLKKVNRSAKASSKDYGKDMINIGVLRGPRDLFADIENADRNSEDFIHADNQKIKEIRSKYGVGNIPQLIIYRIDKDSKARQKNKELDSPNRRIDLNFIDDPIGVYINVPGETKSGAYAKALTVNIKKSEADLYNELDD